jgi:hypothetical protein
MPSLPYKELTDGVALIPKLEGMDNKNSIQGDALGAGGWVRPSCSVEEIRLLSYIQHMAISPPYCNR